jgi:hypothetical protein
LSEQADVNLWLHYAQDPTVFQEKLIVENGPHMPIQNNARLLGFDGKQLWFRADRLFAYDPLTTVLTPAERLGIADLPDEINFYAFHPERKILTITLSTGYKVEIDPVTRQARPLTPDPPMTQERYNRVSVVNYSQGPSGFYWQGEYTAPNSWFGMLSAEEVISAKQGWWSPTRSNYTNMRRRLVRVELNEHHNVLSIAEVSASDYLNSAFLRDPNEPRPLPSGSPPSRYILHTQKLGQREPLCLSRVDLQGVRLWLADTGLREIESIFPGTADVVVLGKNQKEQDELASIDLNTGAVKRAQLPL